MIATLRRGRTLDAGTMGAILHGFQNGTSWMPKLYSGAETVDFCAKLVDAGWVTVADVGGAVAGFLARDGEEVCALYVAEAARREGCGSALLNDAMGRSDALWLRCFQENRAARRFYERHGFKATDTGDGTGNAEGLPDILYEWNGGNGA